VKNAYEVIVIGGGHAGAEAAWAAANLLGGDATVALVTADVSKLGVMSCNPAIGGLAKGQLVREIDALGGLMGLAADASGIMFKMLNTSKGAAVHGPRCQSDKHAYASVVQALIGSRPEIVVVEGMVDEILLPEDGSGSVRGVRVGHSGRTTDLTAKSVVLTTGTFMRALMHTGESKTEGGRVGESSAVGISGALKELGFELGRLKTGTPPRLDIRTIDWEALPVQAGDEDPVPFSDLTPGGWSAGELVCDRFPLMEQTTCRQTRTCESMHELIRGNLDRAPMFSGQITSAGPRYCPSIEDKVVRFADRSEHGVFLEQEGLATDWIYCNGIATSLPADIQDEIIRAMPGCEKTKIVQYGYAVEYDMVSPHQIQATGETRLVGGLFLAGQINGTSGYEEAAAQGLITGLNAARVARGDEPVTLGRDQAYIGVLMDDLVTKIPKEPYRMFTSRAEYRLLLRADNAPDRLTPIAIELGLLDHHELGHLRKARFIQRTDQLERGRGLMKETMLDVSSEQRTVWDRVLNADFTIDDLKEAIGGALSDADDAVYRTLHADRRYEPYIVRQQAEIKRRSELERKTLPGWIDYNAFEALRTEAKQALTRFRPETFGQASRLEGMTPSDITLLSVLVQRARAERASDPDAVAS